MRKVFLIFVFYFVLCGTASAAVTSPYTVDEITAEKPRILFGDSVATSTYNGLENYTASYVDGFLHITFTYTHFGQGLCCSATNPPRLYVTNVDPRATSTPSVRLSAEIYPLIQASHNPEHISDWYLYDIQFSSTGYRVSVKRGGHTETFNGETQVTSLLDTDWVALANLYPIQELPSDQSYSMSFTPVPISNISQTEPTQCSISKIAIIPGSWENTDTKTSFTLQTQDAEGVSCQASQTLRFSLQSTVPGSFITQSGGNLSFFISSSTANRNFYYDDHPSSYTLTATAGYGTASDWPAQFSTTYSTNAEATTTSATTTPVIIIPGIMGTELWEDNVVDNLIWPDRTQIISSISDSFLDILKMDSNGSAVNQTIIAGDIIRELNNADYFASLINSLNLEEDIDLFENPYDWRIDIASSALALKERIDEIKTQRGVDKVNLVAHSMGGLLVKKYLKDYGGGSVETFVDVGTPHLGAPYLYKVLTYGDNLGVKKIFGLVNINADRIKEISQNMPSVYQLLPSRNYFNDADNDYKYYILDLTDGSDRLTFDQTSSYLKSDGRNSALVDRADAFHQEIDNLNPSDYGVETYNIVGCGTPTIGQIHILDDDHYNLIWINGDGSVPLKSAEALTASTTYYVKAVEHALLPSISGVKELITSLITSTTTPDIAPYSNLSLTSTGCTIPDGKIVSMHSPIELHIYDPSGNHAGPDESGDIENEISGVVYETIGDNKFAFLPEGVEYTVEGNATSEGSFDIRIQELEDGEVISTLVFADIPLTATTHTEFNVGATSPTQIPIDSDNDGVFERDYGISTTAVGVLEATGKIVTVTIPVVATHSSSRPASISVKETVIPAPEPITVSNTVLSVPVPTTLKTNTTSPVKVSLSKPIDKSEVIDSPEESRVENSASVYKSLTSRVKSVFLNIWN